jgi:hypothetical protein
LLFYKPAKTFKMYLNIFVHNKKEVVENQVKKKFEEKGRPAILGSMVGKLAGNMVSDDSIINKVSEKLSEEVPKKLRELGVTGTERHMLGLHSVESHSVPTNVCIYLYPLFFSFLPHARPFFPPTIYTSKANVSVAYQKKAYLCMLFVIEGANFTKLVEEKAGADKATKVDYIMELLSNAPQVRY